MNNKFKDYLGNHGFGVSALLIIGAILGFFAIAAAGIIVSGAVIMLLWAWFVTPLFGLPALSIPYAIGLSILSHYMTFQYSGEAEDKSRVYLIMILRPSLAVIIGFIVKSFI